MDTQVSNLRLLYTSLPLSGVKPSTKSLLMHREHTNYITCKEWRREVGNFSRSCLLCGVIFFAALDDLPDLSGLTAIGLDILDRGENGEPGPGPLRGLALDEFPLLSCAMEGTLPSPNGLGPKGDPKGESTSPVLGETRDISGEDSGCESADGSLP
jgi:hypothetical protein